MNSQKNLPNLLRQCLRLPPVCQTISSFLDYNSFTILKSIYIHLNGREELEDFDEVQKLAKLELRNWASPMSFLQQTDVQGEPEDSHENFDVLQEQQSATVSALQFSTTCRFLYWNAHLSDVPLGLRWFSNLKILRCIILSNTLTYNRNSPLAKLPADLTLCSRLEVLEVDGLQFAEFPQNKHKLMTNLKSLIIRHNFVLRHIPSWIGTDNPKLCTVSIVQCRQLRTLPISILHRLDNSSSSVAIATRLEQTLPYPIYHALTSTDLPFDIQTVLDALDYADETELEEKNSDILWVLPASKRRILYGETVFSDTIQFKNLHILGRIGVI